MPTKHIRWYFLLFGLFDALALLAAFFYSLSVLPYFFSYFTVLSNLLVTALFLILGLHKRKKIPSVVALLYGPSVLYMCITGIIFWTILLHHHLMHTVPWINLTLHAVMPLAAAGGWFLFTPQKLAYKAAFFWQIPPLLFVAYTLLRGPLVQWYPYPFLNPHISGGYMGVFAWVGGIITGSLLLSFLLIWIAKRK